MILTTGSRHHWFPRSWALLLCALQMGCGSPLPAERVGVPQQSEVPATLPPETDLPPQGVGAWDLLGDSHPLAVIPLRADEPTDIEALTELGHALTEAIDEAS